MASGLEGFSISRVLHLHWQLEIKTVGKDKRYERFKSGTTKP